jgi:hypothetical protein
VRNKLTREFRVTYGYIEYHFILRGKTGLAARYFRPARALFALYNGADTLTGIQELRNAPEQSDWANLIVRRRFNKRRVLVKFLKSKENLPASPTHSGAESRSRRLVVNLYIKRSSRKNRNPAKQQHRNSFNLHSQYTSNLSIDSRSITHYSQFVNCDMQSLM